MECMQVFCKHLLTCFRYIGGTTQYQVFQSYLDFCYGKLSCARSFADYQLLKHAKRLKIFQKKIRINVSKSNSSRMKKYGINLKKKLPLLVIITYAIYKVSVVFFYFFLFKLQKSKFQSVLHLKVSWDPVQNASSYEINIVDQSNSSNVISRVSFSL